MSSASATAFSRPAPSQAVTQLGVVLLWKIVEYSGLALFTLLVPRWMGPDVYGHFAAALGVVALLTTASSLGGLATFGRYIPQYVERGEWPTVWALFVQLFWARLVVASVLGLLSTILFASLLPGSPWPIIVLTGLAVVFGSTATTCFQVFYGFNRLGRSTCQDSSNRLVLVVLLLAFGGLSSLNAALVGLLVTQIVFLLLGLFWTRTYFTMPRRSVDRLFLSRHLGFGLQFFAAQVLLFAMWRAGESLVLLISGQGQQAAYFSVANAVTMALSMLILQVAGVFIPTLSSLESANDEEGVQNIVRYMTKYLVIGAFFALLAIRALAPVAVGVLMGGKYRPIADCLQILTLGLPAMVVLGVGMTVAVVRQQPDRALRVNAAAFGAFVLASIVAVPRAGALGASEAMVLAVLTGAVLASTSFSLDRVLVEGGGARAIIAGMGALGVSLVPIGSPLVSGSVSVIVLALALLVTGIVRVSEFREVLRLVGHRPRVEPA